MKDHLDLGKWADQVDRSVLDNVAVTEKDFGDPEKAPLLPLEYAGKWGRWDDELEDAKKKLLAAKDPWYFASLGDAEMTLLSSGYLYDTRELNARLRACGFSRFFLGARKEFVKALKEATFLGLHQHWPPITIKTVRILRLCGFEMPPPNAVEVHLPYKMLMDRSLFEYLKGKRVVLVGDKAPELMTLMRTPAFVDAHEHFGPLGQVRVMGAFKTRQKAPTAETSATGGSWLDLDACTSWLKRTDYDVAIFACGAIANFLARRVYDTGRSAFDVGFVFEALVGNEQRKVRPLLKEGTWPDRKGW